MIKTIVIMDRLVKILIGWWWYRVLQTHASNGKCETYLAKDAIDDISVEYSASERVFIIKYNNEEGDIRCQNGRQTIVRVGCDMDGMDKNIKESTLFFESVNEKHCVYYVDIKTSQACDVINGSEKSDGSGDVKVGVRNLVNNIGMQMK